MNPEEIRTKTFECLKKQPLRTIPTRKQTEATSFFNAELGLDWIGGLK